MDYVSKLQLWLQYGDAVFNRIPYESILPVAGLTPMHSYKYLTLSTPIPTMSYPNEQAGLYKRLLTMQKSGNPAKDSLGHQLLKTQVLPRICHSIMERRPIDQLKTMMLTLNMPTHMDIPETWSRGYYLMQRIPNSLHTYLRSKSCTLILITIGLETHRAHKKTKTRRAKMGKRDQMKRKMSA